MEAQIEIYTKRLNNLKENRALESDILNDKENEALDAQIRLTAEFLQVLKAVEQKPTKMQPDPSKKRYSVSAQILDNTTGKDAHVYMDSDEPDKLGESIGKIVQASCGLINLEQKDLDEVRNDIIKKYNEKIKPTAYLFHAKKPNFGFGEPIEFDSDENYELVAEIYGEKRPEWIFENTQNLDESWAQKDWSKLRNNVKRIVAKDSNGAFSAKGAKDFRSTSVGDVVIIVPSAGDRDGEYQYLRCENIGWKEIERHEYTCWGCKNNIFPTEDMHKTFKSGCDCE